MTETSDQSEKSLVRRALSSNIRGGALRTVLLPEIFRLLTSLTASLRRLLLRVDDARECSRPASRQHHRLRREQPRHPHKSRGPHPKRERVSGLKQRPNPFEDPRRSPITLH